MTARPAGTRSGFTLIELLVVIGIIGVLLALSSRPSRRPGSRPGERNCGNNLKQIGLALLNYHDAHGSLPPGRIQSFDPDRGGQSAVQQSVRGQELFLMILPQLEQTALLNAINQSTSILGRENLSLFRRGPGRPGLPGGRGRGRPAHEHETVRELGVRRARTRRSWPGSAATSAASGRSSRSRSQPGQRLPARPQGQGADRRRPERIGRADDRVDHRRDGADPARVRSGPRCCSARTGCPIPDHGWYFFNSVSDTLFLAMESPNFRGDGWTPPIATATSTHPGGVDALIADGSVRFIKDSVDSWGVDPENVFEQYPGPRGTRSLSSRGLVGEPARNGACGQALATRSGGEILGSGNY